MLIYHPMLDPYHCALREISIATDSGLESMEWDRMRILDFFVTFPHLLQRIRLPSDLRAKKAMLRAVPVPYENLSNPTQLFFQLGEIQSAAARLLVASGMFEREALVAGSITLATNRQRELQERILESASFRATEWYAFITQGLSRIPLFGKHGLKERSGVMEFRHDPV